MRLVSLALVFSTIAAALIIIVVQPQEAFLRKKRLRDMRKFLIAQMQPLGGDSCLEEETCGGGGKGGGGSTAYRGPTPLTTNEQIECEKYLYQSGFSEQHGISAETNTYLFDFCGYTKMAIFGKQGDVLLLNEAGQRIKNLARDALLKTPIQLTAGIDYLKTISLLMKTFAAETAILNIYLLDPLPYVTELEQKFNALWNPPKEEVKKTEQAVVPAKEPKKETADIKQELPAPAAEETRTSYPLTKLQTIKKLGDKPFSAVITSSKKITADVIRRRIYTIIVPYFRYALKQWQSRSTHAGSP